MKLEKGKAYFDVSWSSEETKVPDIDTYIFIGKDIFSGTEDEYYFQTPYSYEKHGDFSKLKDQNTKSKAEIILLKEDMVEILYTLDSLNDYFGELKEKHGELFGKINGGS